MSCFIVDPHTVAKIANYISAQINGGFNRTHLDPEIPAAFTEEILDKYGFAVPERVYKKLYLLNWMAFNTRYEGRYPENLDQCSADMRKFKEYDTPLTGLFEWEINEAHWQMLKSMECYLYQCTEGSDLEKSDTYQTVRNMKNSLMNAIVHRAAEYEAAEWK